MFEIVGFGVGFLGLAVAVYQSIASRRATKLHKDSCRRRCKDASDKTRRLGTKIVEFCEVLNHPSVAASLVTQPNSARAYAALHGNMGAVIDVAMDWVRFCENLDEEHRDLFNEEAIPPETINALREIQGCLLELDAGPGATQPREVEHSAST